MQQKKSVLRELKPLFFPVQKIKATTPTGDTAFSNNMDHFIIAETSHGGLVVNACSKNYHLLTNESIIKPLVEKLEERWEIQAKAIQYGHCKFWVDFIVLDKGIQVMKKDTILPRIRLTNSYDGSLKYEFSFGFYRVVCSNGLTVPVNSKLSKYLKLRHTPGSSGLALEQSLKAIAEFVDAAPEIAKGYRDLTDKSLSESAALKLMEEVVEETKYPTRSLEPAVERLHKEIGMGLPINNFLVYNALNYGLYNSEAVMKQHKRDKIDQQVLAYLQ